MIAVHGHEAKQGETAFAFLALRLAHAVDRAGLVAVIRHFGSMIPEAENFIAELPEQLEETMRLVCMPWLPPDDGEPLAAQRALIESSGVEVAWFFQTGTSLPSEPEEEAEEADEDEEADDDEEDLGEGWSLFGNDQAEDAGDDKGEVDADEDEDDEDEDDDDDEDDDEDDDDDDVDEDDEDDDEVDEDDDDDEDEDDDDDDDEEDDEDDDDDDDEEEARWSHGPPPQLTQVRFPVDGYPAILEDLDWEDFGVAVRFAGDYVPGESTVLLGFHALWLTPYGGRYRNAAVTVDRKHHAAHLWVDRFAVTTPEAEQVHHLLWIIAKLDEVMPILHARFAGATMEQKYAGLMGDTSEPFVLAGNPLLGVHASGGERAVDAWLDSQRDWSREEVAQMLRELAVEIVTSEPPAPAANGEEVDAIFEAAVTVITPTADEEDEDNENEDDDDEDEEVDDEDEDEEVDDEEDEDEDEEVVDEDEDGDDDEDDDEDAEAPDDSRYIAAHAAAVLVERARANLLDRRAAVVLRPLLAAPDPARRAAAVDILGALRDRDSVALLVQLLEDTTIADRIDGIAKSDLIERTASALGNIADPAAARALARVATATGEGYDDTRAVAASALAACLAATPEPRDIDDAVLAALLELIGESEDAELVAQAHLAYGRLARQLAPARRDTARRKLDATTAQTTEASPLLARHAALALARADGLDVAAIANLKPLLHASLTSLDYDHEYTVRALRCALAVAELLPELVDAKDLLWLTRFHEPDIRGRAHALLARLGKHVPEAPVFDRARAATLANDELAQRIADPHVVGHAALIAEAAARKLDAARPAIVRVVHGVVERARAGDEHLLDPDTAILDAAVPLLRQRASSDDATIALFDRMLRHSNPHVKWPLVAHPPDDPRLLGGMLYVLSERWSWQARAAREWLRPHEGSAAFEEARTQAGITSLDAELVPDDEDEADDVPADDDDDSEIEVADDEIVFDDDDDQTN